MSSPQTSKRARLGDVRQQDTISIRTRLGEVKQGRSFGNLKNTRAHTGRSSNRSTTRTSDTPQQMADFKSLKILLEGAKNNLDKCHPETEDYDAFASEISFLWEDLDELKISDPTIARSISERKLLD